MVASIDELPNLPLDQEVSVRLLRKIVELVDKDVAVNRRPVSLIGMAIPAVPFMILVDGAPADSFPLLSALALSLGLGWGAFVSWRVLRHTGAKLEGLGYVIESARFWRLVIGTLLLVLVMTAALMWFSKVIG